MKKLVSLNIGTIVTFLAIFYAAYYILLQDSCLHLSIASILNNSNSLAVKKHLLVVGLLPVYIATMIFGAAMLGIYLGSTLQQMLVKKVCLDSASSKNNRLRNKP